MALAAFAGFLLGTYAAGFGLSGWLCLGSVAVATGALFITSIHRPAIYVLAFCLSAWIGLLYFNAFVAERILATQIPVDAANLTGVVQKIEPRGASLQFVEVQLSPPARGRVYLLAALYPEYHAGDSLEITKFLGSPRDSRGRLVPAFPEIKILNPGTPDLNSQIQKIRTGASRILTRALPSREGALVVGLLFGDTSGFDADFKSAMRQSGTTHLVALSGYNITVIVGAIAAAARTMRFSRKLRFSVTLGGIIFFLSLVSAQPSLIRAAVMGTLILLAVNLGRGAHFGYVTALAGALMAWIDPTAPSADVGFQLSFLSLLGISYVAPALRELPFLSGASGWLGWRDGLAATLGAQLAVLPILIRTFGGFSSVSLASNLFILWCIPEIMFLGAALAALGVLVPFLANLLSLLVWLPAAFVVQVITLSARVGGELWSVPLGSIWLVAAYYALLATLISQIPLTQKTFISKSYV